MSSAWHALSLELGLNLNVEPEARNSDRLQEQLLWLIHPCVTWTMRRTARCLSGTVSTQYDSETDYEGARPAQHRTAGHRPTWLVHVTLERDTARTDLARERNDLCGGCIVAE